MDRCYYPMASSDSLYPEAYYYVDEIGDSALTYKYDPHAHIKVWLSNNPEVFMNFENQTRMIEMREKNPSDAMYLVYDARLLDNKAQQELAEFCEENSITALDANSEKFTCNLSTESEKELYKFYKDEIENLKKGGNLGVASDILRWLPSCYRLASYTDLDVPLDTKNFSTSVNVDAPILINVGSLKLFGKQETLIALNEFIAVVDEEKARGMIEKVHEGMLSKLRNFESDYVENIEKAFRNDGFFNRFLIGSMKNREESIYIQKSTDLSTKQGKPTSRELR